MPTAHDRPAPPSNGDAVASLTGELADSAHRSSASFELAFAPVILALLGLWLDRTLGTTPLFVVSFAVLGVLGVGAKVYFQYRHQMEALRADAPWMAGPSDRDGAA
ncbi:MAG: AtpZ/AtpI family protein [Microthrixaceae bacterium]